MKQAQRSDTTRSTPDWQEPLAKGNTDSAPEVDDISLYERPLRTPAAPQKLKRERLESPVPETPKAPAAGKDEQHPASAYIPLKDDEFRILYLMPGRKDDGITCSFETATITQPPKYEAISYLYGGGAKQSPVRIKLRDSHGKSHPIWIRSNLYNALQNLRHPNNVQAYWADALCINHSNANERSRQVEMKRDIFHNAKNVCFWLGEDPNDKLALSFIPKIVELTEVDKLVRDDAAINDWAAFVSLLNNTVFSRLWFVQELAVARNVTVHCGLSAIHYGDLVDAVAMFVSFRDEISVLFRHNRRNHKDLADRKVSMAERFINVSTNALRISSSGEIQRLLSFEALVSNLSDLEATDPRDRIFSVLAIAKDGPSLKDRTLMKSPGGRPQIDYDKPVSEVYQYFVERAINCSKSLDIICRHWASSVSEEVAILPTWVRPYQSFQPPPENILSERTIADSLVGLPGHNYYNASKGKEAKFHFGMKDYLFTNGLHIDTISKLGFRALEGIVLDEWLTLGRFPTVDITVINDFWRTLVADRGPNGSVPPSWYSRAFDYCYHNLTSAGDINTMKLMKESEPTEDNKIGSSLVVKFLERVQSIIWNRRFLVTKDYEWIGLAPMTAKVNDLVCILYGCSVPVVLRRQRDLMGTEYFQLIGECYVHGMMDGEAVDAVDVSKEKEFELR